MAKTTPTSYSQLPVQQFFAGRPIRDQDWLAVQQAQHHLYSIAGATAPLLVRATPWQTTSTSLTQTDAGAAGVDLSACEGVIRCTRPLALGGSDVYRLQLDVMCDDARVDVEVFDALTNTLLGTLSASRAGLGHAADALNLTAAQAEVSGTPRLLYLSIEGAANAPGDTASVWSVLVREATATASQLP